MSVRMLLEEIWVYDCGITKMRLGNPHDGGYVVAREACEAVSKLYSFGIGDDVSFELDLLDSFPNVKHADLYDPTITQLPQDHERFKFHQYGIGKGYRNPGIMGTDNFLKMDVEGAEWQALRDMFWATIAGFSQMVVEFHLLHVEAVSRLSPYFTKVYQRWADEINDNCFMLYRDVLRKVNGFFYCFHVHVNNSLPLVNLDNDWFPPLLEMSFIRKDLVTNAVPSGETFPIAGLDAPNKMDRPDVIWQPLTRRNDVERKVKASQA